MWESSTGGYGLIYIQKASEGVYYVLSMPKLGSKTGTWKVIQQWKTLAQAKAGGEEFAQRVHASKGKSLGTIMSNPRNTTVTKKKRRSAAQIRATKKMIAAARARRGTKKKARRRNPTIRGNYLTARADPRTVRKRTPVHTTRRMNPINNYGIKAGSKWFDGAGWTPTKRNACKWGNLTTCKRIAQKVSDNSGKVISIHSM